MQAERTALGDRGMLEVFARIAHADALHDGAGSQVTHRGERDDLRKMKLIEANPQRPESGFGRVTLSPMGECQPPSNFDARHEGELRARHRNPDEPDELFAVAQLGGPIAPALLYELRLPAVDGRLARLAGNERRK